MSRSPPAVRVLRPQRWSDEERVDHAFQLCLARRPNLAERERLLQYLDVQHKLLAADALSVKKILGSWADGKLDPTGQAAWTNLCSVLLNLHEFITRD